jgi:hypothetical protein
MLPISKSPIAASIFSGLAGHRLNLRRTARLIPASPKGRAICAIDVQTTSRFHQARLQEELRSVTGGPVTLAPGLPPYGIWKSTDGGANFTLLNYQDVCLNPTLARTSLHLEECRHNEHQCHVYAARFARRKQSGQIREHYLCRSGEPKSCVDFIRELQHLNTSDTRPHFLCDI